LPDASPFVCKVETYLRLTGQKYETTSSDVRKAPRKQLPVVEIDGKLFPDSSLIIEALEARRPTSMDAHLDARERAAAIAFKSMLEEHLYFGLLFMRWACDDGWAVFEPSLRETLATMGVPSLMRGVVAKSARRYTVARTRTQGMGRKPRSEVVAICSQLVDALAEQLGDGPFFCGERPTTYDATVYAFALGVLCPAFDNELRRHAAAKSNIVAYVDRLNDRYWKA
ncbi:MAG TPA: glutathione S-transferase family protein, partial [Polyangiaceae bacterium]|nr:glutathione S-transferase family protein [Polyangiaceae bacterium]